MQASIIIPSYNACERLFYNLISLSVQDIDSSSYEVIVIDNGSTDDTQDMLYSNNFDLNLKIKGLQYNKGRSSARNLGLSSATKDLIIFHDSDMIAEKDYVRKHLEAHNDRGLVVAGRNWSRVYTYYYSNFAGYLKNNFLKQTALMGYEKEYRFYNGEPILSKEDILKGSCFHYAFELEKQHAAEKVLLDHYGSFLAGYRFPWSIFITNNCSVEKKAIDAAGVFDEGFAGWGCEDLELGYRLYKNGCRFVKDNSIVSIHQEHPINFIDDGSSSILYFAKKYKDTNVLLFYCSQLAQLTQEEANEILSDIEILTQKEGLAWLTEMYNAMLRIYIDKRLNKVNPNTDLLKEIKKLRRELAARKENIEAILDFIHKAYNCRSFPNSFRAFAKAALNFKR